MMLTASHTWLLPSLSSCYTLCLAAVNIALHRTFTDSNLLKMRFYLAAILALLAVLSLCSSNAAATPVEEEMDAATADKVLAEFGADLPADNSTYVYDGHNVSHGAAMQWCYVSYRGLYSHIEIWGRNWPADNLGNDGYRLKQALRRRLITFYHWHFMSCKPDEYCLPKIRRKLRGFEWRARANSAIGATSRVEHAIWDVSPAVNQAFQIGKFHHKDLCSKYAPDENGKHPGRWEGDLEP